MRFAVVSLHGSTTVEQIERYLPGNYRNVGYAPADSNALDVRSLAPAVVIAGEDNAGWTLDDYVIPRLQSGLIQANEISSDDPVLKILDDEDERTQVELIQSYRFPNVWSLKGEGQDGFWRDTLFANGAVSAEGAVEYARKHNLRIVKVVTEYWDEGPVDPRNGNRVDNTSEIIAGIEYRSRQQVVEPLLYTPKEVTDK